MVTNSRFHRWGYAQCLMDVAEIVVHKPKRDRSRVILNFLREGVRQPRKAANSE
jgi:hypothetical protein